MQASVFKQLTLPPLALGTKDRVSEVATAGGGRAKRVEISNLSAATCFFGTASESMIGPDAPGTDVVEVAPDDSKIFVLAPGQKLFGCANAIGATVSIAISDMLDVEQAAI